LGKNRLLLKVLSYGSTLRQCSGQAPRLENRRALRSELVEDSPRATLSLSIDARPKPVEGFERPSDFGIDLMKKSQET
jgi:hypothetical protein